jgi:hypothetical protein
MDLVTNILALIAAIVGLIGSIYAFLTSRPTRKIIPPDNSIIIDKISRIPLDEHEWKQVKSAPDALTRFFLFLPIQFIFILIISIVSNLATTTFSAMKESVLVKLILPALTSVYGVVLGTIIILSYSFIAINIYLRRQKFGTATLRYCWRIALS